MEDMMKREYAQEYEDKVSKYYIFINALLAKEISSTCPLFNS